MGDMADMAREQEEAVEFERVLAAANRWRLAKEEDRREVFGEVSEPRWFDARGVEVDLDDIDKEYALNIYAHRLTRGQDPYDALSQKLREVILHGREPDMRDRVRGRAYNRAMQREGRRFRAPVDRP